MTFLVSDMTLTQTCLFVGDDFITTNSTGVLQLHDLSRSKTEVVLRQPQVNNYVNPVIFTSTTIKNQSRSSQTWGRID